MDDVIFQDDLREFKKTSYVLIAVSMLAVAAFVANLCVHGVEQGVAVVVLAGIAIALLLGYSVYLAIYVFTYEITATASGIFVKSFFRTKTLEFKDGFFFEYKKYNAKYDIFKISNEANSVTVRTKKSSELISILEKFVSLS